MNQNICCIDVETTGLSIKDDYIIQLSLIKFDKDTFKVLSEKNWYIKPIHKYTITEGAFAAHGLSKEFIDENGVLLSSVVDELFAELSDSDILTYNGNSFDVKMLYKDLKIIRKEFPIEGKIFYDSYIIDIAQHPRTLSALYNKLTGKTIEEIGKAHNSLTDAKATIEIFHKQVNDLTYDAISEIDDMKLLSPDGTIRRVVLGDKTQIVFNVGKYKDSEFIQVYDKDPMYVKWFISNVASDYTKKALREYYKENVKK